MDRFIRVAEIWVPSLDRRTLILRGGIYGELSEFELVSQDTVFERGEGLPGRSWEQRHPLMLTDLENSYFKRTDAAHRAGLT